MKKTIEKIVTIALMLISLLFVITTLVVQFRPEYAADMSGSYVQVLLVVFAAMFAVLTAINIAGAFADSEKINNVLLFKSRESATKATITVVNKTAKQAVKQIEGATLKKVYLFVDENNDVKMRIDLKIASATVEDVIIKVRAAVATTFEEVLGLNFASIDFKLVKVKNEYKPDGAKMDEKVAAFKKELEAEKKKAEAEKAVAAKEAAEEAVVAAEEVVATEEKVEEVVEEAKEATEAVEKDEAAQEAQEE